MYMTKPVVPEPRGHRLESRVNTPPNTPNSQVSKTDRKVERQIKGSFWEFDSTRCQACTPHQTSSDTCGRMKRAQMELNAGSDFLTQAKSTLKRLLPPFPVISPPHLWWLMLVNLIRAGTPKWDTPRRISHSSRGRGHLAGECLA